MVFLCILNWLQLICHCLILLFGFYFVLFCHDGLFNFFWAGYMLGAFFMKNVHPLLKFLLRPDLEELEEVMS